MTIKSKGASIGESRFFVPRSLCGMIPSLVQARVNHDTQPSGTISAPAPSPARSAATLRKPPWPVVAFWAGTAILFGAGGVLHAVRFGEILLRARGGWQSLSTSQMAWVATAMFFFACGAISITLCLLLAGLHVSGFYGSLLFGLLLTLLAPLAALLTPQPDYFAATCLGLLPAGAVLFTLAGAPGLTRR